MTLEAAVMAEDGLEDRSVANFLVNELNTAWMSKKNKY